MEIMWFTWFTRITDMVCLEGIKHKMVELMCDFTQWITNRISQLPFKRSCMYTSKWKLVRRDSKECKMLIQSRFNSLLLLKWLCAVLDSREAAFHVSLSGKITILSMKFIREFFSASWEIGLTNRKYGMFSIENLSINCFIFPPLSDKYLPFFYFPGSKWVLTFMHQL